MADVKAAQNSEESDTTTKDADKQEPIAPKGQMLVKVYSPFKDYFDAPANSVSAVNDTGPFDILPGHHNFLTLLSACELEVRTAEGAEKIKIDRGIMYVKKDKVTVFLDV